MRPSPADVQTESRPTSRVTQGEVDFVTDVAVSTPEITGRVLDLGFRTGERALWWARERDLEVLGLTNNAESVLQAVQSRAAADKSVRALVEYQVGELQALAVEDASVDTIFVAHALEYVTNPSPVLAEIARVTREGGHAVIVVSQDGVHGTQPVWSLDRDGWELLLERYGRVSRSWSASNGRSHAFVLAPRVPRVIAMLRVRDEERFLPRTLASIEGLVDGVVILDDGSTDRTPEICQSHHLVVGYRHQNEAVTDEVRDKNVLLEMTLEHDPDWILALDGDEELEEGGAEFLRREVGVCEPTVSVFSFDVPYLWDDETKFRFDGAYSQVTRHPRMFRVDRRLASELTFNPSKHGSNFHCGSVPFGVAGELRLSPVRLRHYGYMESELRSRKHAFYTEKDPDGAAQGYYNHLLDGDEAVYVPWTQRAEALRTGRADLISYYLNPRPEVLNLVPTDARRILELGCASGQLGRAVKERQQCYLVGVELDEDAARGAKQYFDEVHLGDVEKMEFPYEPGFFDAVICADVLEHLVNPQLVVRKLFELVRPGGQIIVSIPNIRNMRIMSKLAGGRWEYEDEGILDRTHVRFFTRVEFERLLHTSGFRVDHVDTNRDGTFHGQDLQPGIVTEVNVERLAIRGVTAEDFNELAALQFLFVGTKPNVLGPNPAGAVPVVSAVVVADDVDAMLQTVGSLAEGSTEGMYEVVAYDNGTADATAETLTGFEGDVRILRSDKPKPIGTVWNECIATTRGEWIALIDRGVVVQPGWIESLVETAAAEGASFVAGAVAVGKETPSRMSVGADAMLRVGDEGELPLPWCALISRSALEQVGGVSTEYTSATFTVADLFMRLQANGMHGASTSDVLAARTTGAPVVTPDDPVRFWTDWHTRKD